MKVFKLSITIAVLPVMTIDVFATLIMDGRNCTSGLDSCLRGAFSRFWTCLGCKHRALSFLFFFYTSRILPCHGYPYSVADGFEIISSLGTIGDFGLSQLDG